MLRTVWGDPARYEKYWEQIPGCYTCGDIAVRDHDGYFAVLGRSDDVMNVAGHRIGTADVEGSLLRHPAVAESAVIGLPDALKGERIKAFVVLKAGGAGRRGPHRQPQGPRAPGPRPHRRAERHRPRRVAPEDALGEDRAGAT